MNNMENEIWKDIPNYDGIYQASNLGRIKSLDRYVKHSSGNGLTPIKGRIFKPQIDSKGYYGITLSKDGKPKTMLIHKLIAITFLEHKPDGTQKIIVDHIDNNKRNNRLDNLQLISQRMNCSKNKKNKTSKYTGVFWDKRINRWVSKIVINGKQKYLGSFINEEDAYKVYKTTLNGI